MTGVQTCALPILRFWYGCINYEQRPPQPDELKLEYMRALLNHLGNPQNNFPIVHVAGSKGKGSTSAMLAAILRVAGYQTGLFTSPHLCRIEERMQVNGVSISPLEIAALMSEVRSAIQAMEGNPCKSSAPVNDHAFVPSAGQPVTWAASQFGSSCRTC